MKAAGSRITHEDVSKIEIVDCLFPDVELVAAKIHDAWMAAKKEQGIESRLSESGEELMVPYAELSEMAKDLDRAGVIAVYAAIQELWHDMGARVHDDDG